ncbi:MAG: DUF11 domain-containing protein, partial [Saprospiraceae bacterium]|nr:DUF11 domain-containing protein [Saprospiraceae bacterium]
MKRIVFLLHVMLSLAAGVSAQNLGFWTKIQGPSGGWPGKLINAENGVLYVNSSSQDDLFPARLFRSSDQGQHWAELSLSVPGQQGHRYVEVSQSGTMYTLLPDNNNSALYTLYSSTNEGVTWDFIRDSLPYQSVIATPGGALLAHTYLGNEFWRSADGGLTWSLVYMASATVYSEATVLQNGDLAWHDFSYNWYRSVDDGLNWQALTPSSTNYSYFFIGSAGTLMILDWNKMHRSTDNGQSWQVSNIPPIESIVELQTGRLIANRVADSKLLYSDDSGLTWALLPSSHEMSHLMPTRLPDGSIFGSCNALYKSADGGGNWQFAATDMDMAQVDQTGFVSGDSIFAATQNGIWRSFDAGQQWTRLAENTKIKAGSDRSKRIFVLGENGRLAAFVDSILYWSDDYGDHFTNISPPGGTYSLSVAMSPGDSFLFVNSATYPRHILRSADHGQSWQTVNDGQENSEFYRMEFHSSGRFFAIRRQGANSLSKLWYSDDRGMTWYPVAGLPPGLMAGDLHIDISGNIYTVDYNAGNGLLFRSTDNGNSWLRLPGVETGLSTFLHSNMLGHILMFDIYGIGLRSLDQGASWFHFPGFAYHLDQFLDPMSPDQYLYGQFQGLGLCRTTHPTTEGSYLDGYVRRDADADCSTPDAQAPLRKWAVEANGPYTFWTITDSLGHYQMFLDSGMYEVQAWPPNSNWWTVCEGAQSVFADSLLSLDTVDFSAAALAECPLMSVDMSIQQLRRCFNNTVYINYCNQGTEPADSAWVDLTLDPFADFVSAGLPAQSLGFNTYRFFVGSVAPTDCGSFTLVVHIDCDSTVLGQTHCFSAHAYPDTLCTPVPDWSGAMIQASVECQDTLVNMTLKNTGNAPSQLLNYIIIIDDVVLMEGQKSYDINQAFTFPQPANGHTWRIQSEQEPGHPFSNIALAFAEGCGGYESLGYINQFPVDELLPSTDRECMQNTGAFDPNDKQGFPLGYGDTHRIRPGQDLEYLIRFQNTGTDTAFTVVVLDTLSTWLDPASVRPGAASHPYTWALSGQGVISFTFDHILLPDSNTNEAASHGFI